MNQIARFCRIGLIVALAWSNPVEGQTLGPSSSSSGEALRVYVMTMGPGEFVWERFGHNAIRVRDELRGTDIAYNYGMFSFEQEGFVLRFIRGHMDYWMQGIDTAPTADFYIGAGRSVWMQELDLTPEQRVRIRDFLEWNALPENRVYRYDYYRDNCSTRVRDAIDRVIGGQLRAQTEDVPAGATYRDHTRRLTADDPLVYAGLMAGLAQPVDVEISVWDEMFLPMQLRDHLRGITVTTAEGEQLPLVLAEEEIYSGERPVEESFPPTRMPAFLAGGLILGGLLWGAGRSSGSSRTARNVFRVIGTGWAVIAGTLGLVLLGLWLFTDHQTSYRNENLFILSPFLVPLIALIPAASGRGVRARPLAQRLAFVVAAISLVGFAIQLLPAFYQWNGEIVALGLPANVGLALGLREVGRRADGPIAPTSDHELVRQKQST